MKIRPVRIKLRPIQNFFQGASLLLALVIVALLSAVTTMHFAIHGAEVQVPALKGMTVVEARSQTAGLGLDLEVDNRYYSADVAAGHILSQSPVPKAVVRREWRVRVAESLGPQKVEVPSVVGSQERTAALSLRRVGLDTGMTSSLPYGKVSPGTVLAQDPPPRAQGIEKPSVNLLVAASDDSQADGFVMPELVGLPIISAQAALTRVGIKSADPQFKDAPLPHVASPSPIASPSAIGSSSATTSLAAPVAPAAPSPVAPLKPSILPGTVIGQSPPPGWRVEVGSTVALTVAR